MAPQAGFEPATLRLTEPRSTSCGCSWGAFLAGFLMGSYRALRSASFVTPTPCLIVSHLCEVFHSGPDDTDGEKLKAEPRHRVRSERVSHRTKRRAGHRKCEESLTPRCQACRRVNRGLISNNSAAPGIEDRDARNGNILRVPRHKREVLIEGRGRQQTVDHR